MSFLSLIPSTLTITLKQTLQALLCLVCLERETYFRNVVPLQRVFHSNRFKVNKGRGSAESLFYWNSVCQSGISSSPFLILCAKIRNSGQKPKDNSFFFVFSSIGALGRDTSFRRICNPAALSIRICNPSSCLSALQMLIFAAVGLQIRPNRAANPPERNGN